MLYETQCSIPGSARKEEERQRQRDRKWVFCSNPGIHLLKGKTFVSCKQARSCNCLSHLISLMVVKKDFVLSWDLVAAGCQRLGC
jgi:hypothetical protein